jgi:hypothetical protein
MTSVQIRWKKYALRNAYILSLERSLLSTLITDSQYINARSCGSGKVMRRMMTTAR